MRKNQHCLKHVFSVANQAPALRTTLFIFFLLSASIGCSTSSSNSETKVLPAPNCTDAWFTAVENSIDTSDGQGHGPDIGSAEWHSVIEFKLGIRDSEQAPAAPSQDWCNYIERTLITK